MYIQERVVKKEEKRLIIVSNRLPIICQQNKLGKWNIEPSSGGLISAMDPVFRNRGGLWIGWPGTTDVRLSALRSPLNKVAKEYGYNFVPVLLDEKEKEDFYQGFSNEIIWPLFHDLQSRCNFKPEYYRSYKKVNKRFAWVVGKNCGKNDFVWVHDYHLMDVAQELRKLKVKSKIGFFLHIPFPSLDIFLKLPWRFQILKSLLEFDLLGFQTARDLRNFIQCVKMMSSCKAEKQEGFPSNVMKIRVSDREVTVGSFPISIDYEAFAKKAATPEILAKAKKLREDLPNRQLIIGVDRLDYTKGLPYKLEAFRNALQRYPRLRQKVTLVQNVVPSREDISEYHDLKTQIEQLVGEINGQYTQSGWVPIHYIFHHMDRAELLAYYRMAKIALVTPLKDGMNLVAKEYCAANVEEDSVLILSEFAGAASQMQKSALLVNPYDIEEVADKIFQAFTMDPKERHAKMRRLRKNVRENDIFKWAETFLKVAFAENPKFLPNIEDHLPHFGIA